MRRVWADLESRPSTWNEDGMKAGKKSWMETKISRPTFASGDSVWRLSGVQRLSKVHKVWLLSCARDHISSVPLYHHPSPSSMSLIYRSRSHLSVIKPHMNEDIGRGERNLRGLIDLRPPDEHFTWNHTAHKRPHTSHAPTSGAFINVPIVTVSPNFKHCICHRDSSAQWKDSFLDQNVFYTWCHFKAVTHTHKHRDMKGIQWKSSSCDKGKCLCLRE